MAEYTTPIMFGLIALIALWIATYLPTNDARRNPGPQAASLGQGR